MTRAEYKALRSQARHAARVADIRFETGPSAAQIESDRHWAARLAALVPGGLTAPFKHAGFGGLLPEWNARRNAVRNAVRLRHIAEREQSLPTVARRAA